MINPFRNLGFYIGWSSGAEKHLLDSSTISLAYEKQYNLRCLVGEKGLVISCIKGESLPENCSLGRYVCSSYCCCIFSIYVLVSSVLDRFEF